MQLWVLQKVFEDSERNETGRKLLGVFSNQWEATDAIVGYSGNDWVYTASTDSYYLPFDNPVKNGNGYYQVSKVNLNKLTEANEASWCGICGKTLPSSDFCRDHICE